MSGGKTVDVVLVASAAILKAWSAAGVIAGVPGVKQASELLLAFIHAIQNMAGNDAKRLEISNHIEVLARIVADIQERVSRDRSVYSRALEDRVMHLNSELVQYEQTASRLAAMGGPERLFKSQEIAGILTGLSEGVKMSCERTNTRALFNIEVNQAHQGQAINQIQENVARILKSSEAVVDPVTKLPCANAAFDSINLDNKNEVLAGTRVAVMEEVERWGTTARGERVFWLRGAAGTGKSTIAKSVAAKYKRANRLGASFFFVQGVQDLGDTRLLITTLACHLARADGPVGAAIRNAARRYFAAQTPGEKNSASQFDDLLLKPLRNLDRQAEPIIVVIDAVDEASDRIAVVANLGRLTRQLVTLPINIKLFVTSRPDPEIEAVLSGASLLVLHDIEKTILDHDIKLYIEYAFREIQDSKKAFQYTPEDVQSLVDHSGGLFIYVSTAIKLLKDSIDPSKALQGLFTRQSDHMLDELYLQVLERAFGGHDWDSDVSGNKAAWNERLRIVGTIVLSQDRHSCSTLAGLLDKSTAAIRDALSHLDAVILVPQDDDLPVRILHASFTDFIVDGTRCTNPHFALNITEHHSFLAEECIHHMNRLLEENPCRISDPYALNSEVLDLDERIDQFVPSHLQYASRSWAYHLSLSRYSTSLKEQLRVFCKIHILEWLEVMSLFGRVDLAITHLDTAFNWIKANDASPSTPITSSFLRMKSLFGPATEDTSDEVSMLLYDAYRFTLHFADTITASARHIYLSALPPSPSCLLYETYQARLSSVAVNVHHSRDHTWPPYLRTLDGHSGPVRDVAMSKDGAHVASGSNDMTLRVWDSSTGTLLARYKTGGSSCYAISFSGDGSHVIAFTNNGVFVCNWPTGTSSQWLLPAPQYQVYSNSLLVASNTGTCFVLSGNATYGQLQWWDLKTGLRLKSTGAHSPFVTSVAFSPDDSKIVIAYMDKSMYLREAPRGKLLRVFSSTMVQDSVSFSPNGHQIFSASKDRVCVWDVQTGAKLRQRKCIPARVGNLKFSPDGTRLVTVVDTGRILVFDTSSGACTFEGSFGRQQDREWSATIQSTAFSADGTRVFSGLSDGTIRIWDLSVDYSKPDTPEPEYYGTIEGVAFSPADGTRICTWAWSKHHIRVWDLSTGRLLLELKGHTLRVTSVAFSPDGTQIASASNDKTIRIWDSVNGHQVKKLDMNRPIAVPALQGQTLLSPDPTVVTFSEDGHVCVYGAVNFQKTVTQWDTTSGKVVSQSRVPYNQTAPGQPEDPLLEVEDTWIVPVSDPSRKLFRIPVTYLPLRDLYTHGPFAVLVGQEKFAMLDFSHII
ncbi:hypothetical protein AB1N83_010713 [Pleurotus pulmonarius]